MTTELDKSFPISVSSLESEVTYALSRQFITRDDLQKSMQKLKEEMAKPKDFQVLVTLDSCPPEIFPNKSTNTLSMTTAHVHGPDCNHGNDHLPEEGAVKFNIEEFGDIDLVRTFATAKYPVWHKTPMKMMEAIHASHQATPKDTFLGVFLNAEAYKWLLTSNQFQRMFIPAATPEQLGSGFIGTIGQRIVLLTDAFMEPQHQVTMNGAMYMCQLVAAPKEEAAPEIVSEKAEDGNAA